VSQSLSFRNTPRIATLAPSGCSLNLPLIGKLGKPVSAQRMHTERERQNEETHDQSPPIGDRLLTLRERPTRTVGRYPDRAAPQQQNQYPERNLPPAAVASHL
jgi:hypothetical protein